MLSMLRTMWEIFIHLFRKAETIQYPEEMPYLAPRYRGRIVLTRDPDGEERCVACNLCAAACPVDCIKIETEKAPERGTDIKEIKHRGITSNGTKKALVVTRFDIDMTECCYCNLCTYPCPEECIFMTGGPNGDKHPIDYEFSEPDRNDLIYRFAKPGTKEGMEKILNEKKAEA